MDTNRRLFLTTALSSASVALFATRAMSQSTAAPPTDDVLGVIRDEIFRLAREFQPGVLVPTVRGLDAQMTVLAVYYRRYDKDLQQAIKRAIKTKGRRALLDEVQHPKWDHEQHALLEQHGLGDLHRDPPDAKRLAHALAGLESQPLSHAFNQTATLLKRIHPQLVEADANPRIVRAQWTPLSPTDPGPHYGPDQPDPATTWGTECHLFTRLCEFWTDVSGIICPLGYFASTIGGMTCAISLATSGVMCLAKRNICP